MEDLGDRIKNNYENRDKHYLTRRMPVIMRIDGCAFHTFTKNFKRPFDIDLINSMVNATVKASERIQGFKCAFVQSDEISILLTDYDSLETSAWFDYNQSKLESVTASMITAHFQNPELYQQYTKLLPYFDCRAFNIPREEVVNYFLWRGLDWKRNSLNMYCQSFFSHKELENKNQVDKHDMLHVIGKNWADLPSVVKNGTFVFRDVCMTNVLPKYEDLAKVIKPLVYCDESL